ncbi:Transcriptional regulator CRZ1 [Choanephora cucurbitarum]|uniref:Zinc finger protein 865 n=1 Tax=Choanephora cucurbitarum TaxID=101091 RepID=A0A1C7NCS6_9FUNG|nr:Transcriptional regulator CRZ1 [Choanephora cucurbitarum]
MKEYLPTPVTPASEFPQFQNPNTSSFSTFSVIKPPITPNQNNTRNSQPAVPTEAKPYPCPECHQTFSRPHNLKSHLTTHSSERPFQCDVCNHHFRRHHDLKRHQKLHTGERPYVCKDCFRSFARLDALNRHRRAEGGTACSAVHLVKQEIENVSSNSNATYHTNNKPTTSNTIADTTSPIPTAISSSATLSIPASTAPTSRPVIPQLHIPHPASHLYPRDSQPPTTAVPPSATIPSAHSPPLSGPPPPSTHLLPSPSALSTLPITNNNNLTPIVYQPKSLPITPSSPPPLQQNKSPTYHPHAFHPWSPYRSGGNSVHTESTSPVPSRPTLPPLGSPPAEIGSKLERLQQENEDLKRDIDQLRAIAQKEAGALKSRVHDLEIENKVLRSLIQNPIQTTTTTTATPVPLPATGHTEDYLKRKRKNSTSPESHTSHDSNNDCGRKSPCLRN